MEPRTPIEIGIAAVWRQLFGLDEIGVEDDFFELGGHSLLATQLLNRLRKMHPDATLSLAVLFERPNIAQLAEVVSSSAAAADTTSLPSLADLAADSPAGRNAFLRTYLADRLEIPDPTGTEAVDGRGLAAELAWDLRRDFELAVYPHEIRDASSLEELASRLGAIIAGERSKGAPEVRPSDMAETPTESAPEPLDDKNPSLYFVLSAPRSGSTLLRLMLAGHPDLFCPPEIALLNASGMQRWQELQHGLFERDGLTRAFMELEGLEAEAAAERVAALVAEDRTTAQVYGELQALCEPRTLVDKGPAYALDTHALLRGEAYFESPRYIVLARHPLAVMESLVRHRMEVLLSAEPVEDPWKFAEAIWRRAYRNLLALEERVGSRSVRVRYEDLVREPDRVMRELAEFLGIPFDAGLLEPYAGGRMIDGPGDPDIFQHEGIDSSLADRWRSVQLPAPLDEETLEIASSFGYETDTSGAAPSGDASGSDRPGAASLGEDQAAGDLLARLDELSDDEVEATLSALLDNRDVEGP